MTFSGAAPHREAVDARLQQEARLRTERRLVDRAGRRERRRHGRTMPRIASRSELPPSHCLLAGTPDCKASTPYVMAPPQLLPRVEGNLSGGDSSWYIRHRERSIDVLNLSLIGADSSGACTRGASRRIPPRDWRPSMTWTSRPRPLWPTATAPGWPAPSARSPAATPTRWSSPRPRTPTARFSRERARARAGPSSARSRWIRASAPLSTRCARSAPPPSSPGSGSTAAFDAQYAALKRTVDDGEVGRGGDHAPHLAHPRAALARPT